MWVFDLITQAWGHMQSNTCRLWRLCFKLHSNMGLSTLGLLHSCWHFWRMLNSGLIFHTSSSIGSIWIRGETGVFAQFAHRYSTNINGCSEPPVPPKAGLGSGAPGLWPRLVAGLGERLGWYKGEELGELATGATAGCLGLLGAGGTWEAMNGTPWVNVKISKRHSDMNDSAWTTKQITSWVQACRKKHRVWSLWKRFTNA